MALKPKEINKLLPHVVHECSDLPAMHPLFSSSACDAWRDRMLLKGHKGIKQSDFLSDRYHCTRSSTGRGPMNVRVVCKSTAYAKKQSSAATLAQMEKKLEVYEEKRVENGCRKSTRVQLKKEANKEKENILKHQCSTGQDVHDIPVAGRRVGNSEAIKRKHAAEILEWLNSSKMLRESEVKEKERKDKVAKEIELIHVAQRKEREASEKLEAAAAREAESLRLSGHIQDRTTVLEELNKKISASEEELQCYQKQMKNQKDLARYYDGKKKHAATSSNGDRLLVKVIKEALCQNLKGSTMVLRQRH